MKMTLIILSLLLGQTGFAAMSPEFKTDCRAGNYKFSVSLNSESGEVTSDDMSFVIIQNNEKVRVEVKPAWFHPIPLEKGTKSVCTGIPAFKISRDRILLFMGRDDRPLPTQTMALLYNLKSKKVEHMLENVGQLDRSNSEGYSIKRSGSRFSIWLIREFKDETIVSGWRKLRVKDSRIQDLGWK